MSYLQLSKMTDGDDCIIFDVSEWTFLAKGMANCVFKYKGNDSRFKGKALRLRLTVSSIPSEEVVEYVNKEIRPAFKDEKAIIEMTLVPLSPSFLSQISKTCPDIDIRLTETHGILMPDLFLLYSDKEITETLNISKHIKIHLFENVSLLEFKPKWLYSPPSEFKRCRNCALNLNRYGDDLHELCTLQLLSLDKIPKFCHSIVKRVPESYNINEISLEHAFVNNFDSIQTLYKLQRLDKDIHQELLNLNNEYDISEELLLSMTLKDVTIFLPFYSTNTSHDDNCVTLTIIDLDKKSRSKFQKWKNQELKLKSLYY